jgi:hypothetical protein
MIIISSRKEFIMTHADLSQDLAFVRQVAEEGRNAPYIGGPELVGFGGVTALAFAGHWAIGTFGIVPWAFIGLWVSYGIVMGLMGRTLRARARAQALPGAGAISNRVDGLVWSAVTYALAATVIGTLIQAALIKDPIVVNWIVPASLALYGVALLTTGRFCGLRTLVIAALLAFLASIGLTILVNDANLYLYGALAVVISMVVPGALLSARPSKPNL